MFVRVQTGPANPRVSVCNGNLALEHNFFPGECPSPAVACEKHPIIKDMAKNQCVSEHPYEFRTPLSGYFLPTISNASAAVLKKKKGLRLKL